MAGDFVLAVASMMIARLKDNDVTLTLSQVGSAVQEATVWSCFQEFSYFEEF